MGKTTVDTLSARRLQLVAGFDRVQLERAQMALLRSTLTHARKNSSLYRQRFAGIRFEELKTRADLARLPFLTADDVTLENHRLQCVSQSEVVRVITMQTSGSTGQPKRFSFTRRDLAATSDFFLSGMENLVTGGDRVLVLLPFEQEASVGELLIAALAEGDIYAEGLWPPESPETIAARIVARSITCVVGLPQQLLALAEVVTGTQIKTMLLCSDYSPHVLRQRIEKLTGCTTFLHYGATESGLGGGVECDLHRGVHLRESDLLVEIVDPDTGVIVEDGVVGEVVLTTLGREAMPLIRYRTGDMASLDRSLCACGGVTARLCDIYGRMQGCRLGDGSIMYNQLLDDQLFRLDGLVDYRATLQRDGGDRLDVDFIAASGGKDLEGALRELLLGITGVAASIQSGHLRLGTIQQVDGFAATHTLKRTILDLR